MKNTDWVIGIVVYTGRNTKIFKNYKKPPVKLSNIKNKVNNLLYSVILFQLILCILFAIGSTIWENSSKDIIPYLQKYNNDFRIIEYKSKSVDLIYKILGFIIANSYMVPMSLNLSMEIVKILQGVLINYDNNMLDVERNIEPISRTSDLIDELGQVKFIFADKTGTLTKNEMNFKKCFIFNRIYGDDDSFYEDDKSINQRPIYNVNNDIRPFVILKNKKREQKLERKLINDFFTIMAVCNSALSENKGFKTIFQVRYF